MAQPPIQYFRKEDFPELQKEPWALKLFAKLNGLARQSQYALSGNVSVAQNMAGFWWEGIIGCYTATPGLLYPFTYTTQATLPKTSTAIKAFPFTFPNTITPKNIKAVLVAQAFDVTDSAKGSFPAMVDGVAWVQEGANIKVLGINGMLTGTGTPSGRAYFTRLLCLSE